MALSFQRELVKDAQGRIKYKIFNRGGREHFNIRIWLDALGDELNLVEKVDYELHPTFRRRHRSSTNKNDKFEISIWTWGMFAIGATIHFKDGSKEETQFYLSYDLPDDDGTNYVRVSSILG